MRTICRYLTLIALMFWLGGFTFYASVVVPVGTSFLNSDLRQGFITRQVTYFLNITAVVALCVLLMELTLTRDTARRRRWLRVTLWLLMVVCQGNLFYLHEFLDSQMQVRGLLIRDREVFRPAHRIYLWTHTVQWGAGLIYIGLMLGAWQREDTMRAREKMLQVLEK